MSGQNSITINVDASGALQGIQGTDEALRRLGATAAACAGQFQALQGAVSGLSSGQSAIDTMLGALPDMLTTVNELHTALRNLPGALQTLGLMAAPITATTEATAAATAATRALAVAQAALPLVAIGAAIAALGVGLYEMFNNTQESTRQYKNLNEAMTALRPVIGGNAESLDSFVTRMDKATASTRRLTLAALDAAKATAESDRKQQQAAASGALARMQAQARANVPVDPMGGNFVAQADLGIDPDVVKTLQDFANSATKDVADLAGQLYALGPAGKEALQTLVDFQGKQVSLLELAVASQGTNEALGTLAEQARIARGELTETEQATLRQAKAAKGTADAVQTQADSLRDLADAQRDATDSMDISAGLGQMVAQFNAGMAASQEALNAQLEQTYTQIQADFNATLAANAATPSQIMAEGRKANDAAAETGKKQAEEVNKTADAIAKGWGEALFGQITGKGDSIKNWFKGLFKQIASDALKNKIIVPVTSAITGALGGFGIGALTGTADAAGGSGGSGATGGGLLESLSGGLTKALDGLQAGVNKLGSSLFGEYGRRGTATDGLLGHGGQFLGSTDLATGITGALSGVGLGMTAGGLLGALGIGKGNQTGSAIGGAIGGVVGSFVPVLGTALGGILGGALGSLFGSKPSNKEGNAVIDLSAGTYAIGGFTGKKYSQENRDAAGDLAKQVLSIKDALEKGFGARVTGTLAVGAGDRDGLFATTLNSTARTSFSKDEAGAKQLVAFVTGQFVSGIKDQLAPEIGAALGRVDFADMTKAAGDLDFIRNFRDSLDALKGDMGLQNQAALAAADAVRTQTEAVKQFRETTARLFPDAVAEADAALKSYVEGLVGIRQAADPLTQMETAMVALQARFEAYKPLLEEVGYTAEQAQAAIASGLKQAKDQLKGDYEKTLDRQYNDLTGKGYVNQINDLIANRDTGLKDAAALGVDPALVTRNFTAGLEAQVKGLDKSQLEGLLTSFADMPAVVDVVNTALAKLNGTLQQTAETADQIVARAARTAEFRDGLLDRRARARGEADTQTGQLAIFDRAAEKEKAATEKRVQEGELAATVLTELEATLAAEREAITRDFAARELEATKAQAEKVAEINRSLEDRVAALLAVGDKDGDIRLLERKQKAEYDAAKAAGWTAEQLSILSDVLNGEMGNAVAEKQRQAAAAEAAVTSSLADRVATLYNSTLPDGDIRNLERKQKAEYDAAVAAGWTAGQLAVLSDVLKVEMAQAIDAAAQRLRSLNDGIADRLFAATTDTSTLSGALSAFDRKIAKERADIAKTAGADLVSFDAATAAERLKIERDFAEQAASLNQGFADRLFAATNDADTLSGALAAFDQQAARERLDAAKKGGVNLALLEKAQGAERARIVKSFADKAIAEAQATADAARDKLVQAYQREADAARTLAADWREAGKSIRDALKADNLSDQYSNLNPDQRAALAEQELRDLAARASDPTLTAQERLAAAQALPAARRAFLDAVRPLYEGTERWGNALDLSARLLEGVADTGDQQADLTQRQVDLAEGQLTALGVVNDSILSVADALDEYRKAVEKLAEVKANPTPEAQQPAPAAGTPANDQPAARSIEQVRADLSAAVSQRTLLGDTEVLTWTQNGQTRASLTAADLATRPLDYLLDIARLAGLAGYQQGGMVGNGRFNADSVLARYQGGGFIALAGGEFVTRATSVTADTAPILRAINDTGRPPAGLRSDEGSARLERLLAALLTQAQDNGKRQADLDARGYDLLADRLGLLLAQAQDAAADRRRVAR